MEEEEEEEMKNAIVASGELPFAALPSDDDGLVELPSDDCDDGGASSSQGIAKRRRLWSAQALQGPRGDHPHDVIPGPSAGDSLVAGGPRSDHPRDVTPGPNAGDFPAHWSRMTLRVIQQTHYYEDQTRKFLQW